MRGTREGPAAWTSEILSFPARYWSNECSCRVNLKTLLNTEDTEGTEECDFRKLNFRVLMRFARIVLLHSEFSLRDLRVLRVQSLCSLCSNFLALIAPSGVSWCFRNA